MTKRNAYNNDLKIGELPDLRVLAIDILLFHEQPDTNRRAKLAERFFKEGILKNPPIVAETPEDEFIILDGANRITALTEHGIPHVVVQVVNINDEKLYLDSWHHAVEKYDSDYFCEKIEQIDGLKLFDHSADITHETVMPNSANPATIKDNHQICTLIFHDGRLCTVASDGDLARQVRQLKEITDLYLNEPISDRVSYVNPAHLNRHYPAFRTLFTFRRFDKNDLASLTRHGEKLPAGITRVFLPKRALGLNVPLFFLNKPVSLEEKNKQLNSMILDMVRSKSIRFYREPTFAFDE